MRIKTTKDSLVEALQRVKGVVSTQMPILSHVLFEASASEAYVTATDLELVVRTRLKCEIERLGKAAIPSDLLALVKPLGGLDLVLETDERRAVVTCEQSRRTLHVMPDEDFPEVSLGWADTDMDGIPCDKSFSEAMSRVFYCVSAEGDPFSVSGVFLQQTASGLTIVASDGHRLARVTIPATSGEAGLVGESGIVIPRRGALQLMALVNGPKTASMIRTDKALRVTTSMTALEIRLLPKEFPRYEEIIPVDRPYHVDFDRDELSRRLKGLLPVVKGNWSPLTFIFTGDNCELSLGGADRAALDEMVVRPAEGVELHGFRVSMNIRYVHDAVSSLTGDTVRMEWVDNLHGITFCPPDGADRELHLIMPMVV